MSYTDWAVLTGIILFSLIVAFSYTYYAGMDHGFAAGRKWEKDHPG